MKESGRIADVLLKDEWFFPNDPEKMTLSRCISVWADPGMKGVIAGVEGVDSCYNNSSETQYHVYLDPRYDRDVVKRNIKLAVIFAMSLPR
jgi:hypothetical protein